MTIQVLVNPDRVDARTRRIIAKLMMEHLQHETDGSAKWTTELAEEIIKQMFDQRQVGCGDGAADVDATGRTSWWRRLWRRGRQ